MEDFRNAKVYHANHHIDAELVEPEAAAPANTAEVDLPAPAEVGAGSSDGVTFEGKILAIAPGATLLDTLKQQLPDRVPEAEW